MAAGARERLVVVGDREWMHESLLFTGVQGGLPRIHGGRFWSLIGYSVQFGVNKLHKEYHQQVDHIGETNEAHWSHLVVRSCLWTKPVGSSFLDICRDTYQRTSNGRNQLPSIEGTT